MSEAWGPWIKHDGKGCPCAGKYVRVKARCFEKWLVEEGFAHTGSKGWDWSNEGKRRANGLLEAVIIEYQIRKPRGLTILEKLIADLPEEVEA